MLIVSTTSFLKEAETFTMKKSSKLILIYSIVTVQLQNLALFHFRYFFTCDRQKTESHDNHMTI